MPTGIFDRGTNDGGDMTMTSTLPGPENVGSTGNWKLPTANEPARVDGRFIGMASSQRETHNRGTEHVNGFAPKGKPCSACRWSVFRVFREDGGWYAIHHTGMSTVPGETLRFRHERVSTAHEVVESMTTRRNQTAFLTAAAAKVLAQCAGHDIPLRDAYENRAVS
jgi:hypothetical protein